jgi:uncharacterized membrane protein/Mg-chelatase subunit ChlD
MTIFPRFVFPWVLCLLVLVPWSIWVGARMRSLNPVRKWLAIGLRSVILACLIGALAGAELVRINDKLAVFFLVDQSNSIPGESRYAAVKAVQETCDRFMTAKDEAGVVAFGEEPSIELRVKPKPKLEEIKSYVGGEETDLAAAIRLAMAAFPQGAMKRIVVYSDGNETKGSAIEEVKLAQAAGVEVNVVPLHIGGVNEIRVREVTAPSRVSADEPFKLQVVVNSEQDCEGLLRVFQRTRDGKREIQRANVTLQPGDNAFLLPQELGTSGFYEYEASVESESDTVSANNVGRAFTVIQGEPTVLYLEGDPEHSQRLGPALVEEGVKVVTADLGSFPNSLAQFQSFDSVVLSNVSSTDLTSGQIGCLEVMVRDLGIGLVMVGGPDSFGAGGYFDTPVERALPVNMDLKERKVMPRGALVLILHTCEMPEGNAWTREIGLASLNVLSSQDMMGALAYHWEKGEDWLFPLQPVGDKHLMRRALNTTSIGDMPDVHPTLEQAYLALRDANASAKRVVIISDGDPAAPARRLLNDLAAAKISVSTVCIAPHGNSDQGMMRNIAEVTGGEYYFVSNAANLPQIFTKEAAVVKRGLLIEKEIHPQLHHDSEVLRGVIDEGVPMLRGYVATTPKENASLPLVSEEGDPILAHWRYGLGKSVAFTSDVTNRWAAEWLKWDGFKRFWSQAIRWSVREATPSNFQVETRAREGRGYVRIDAVDEDGKFVNFLRPQGVVTGPGPRFERQELSLNQTAPGIYEGDFPLDAQGVYMVNLAYTREDGSQGMLPAGLALGYSREYEYSSTNYPLLEQMAAMGGGKVLGVDDSPFEHTLVATPAVTPIWQFLVALAVCLFPFEIFIRRVVVDFLAVFRWIGKGMRALPGLRRLLPAPRRTPVVITGVIGEMSSASEGKVFTSGGPDLLDVTQDDEADTAALAGTADGIESNPVAVAEKKGAGSTDYTSQLLAAKERALKGRKRR